MIATIATALALLPAAPALPPAPAPLQLAAHRTPGGLAVQLSRTALVILRADRRTVDQWLAPAGCSLHPLAPARPGRLRLEAVDGGGSTATRVVAAVRPARPA